MKAKRILFSLGILLFVFASVDVKAGKRVVVKKARNSHYHHKTPKSKVVYARNAHHVKSIRVLPRSAVVVKHKGAHFHYHGGVYYRHYGGYYYKVLPPRGLRVKLLPRGYVKVLINNRLYYYVEGVYYKQSRNGRIYEVVEAPIGAIVRTLPAVAEEIRIDGKPFYECNLTVYKKVKSSHGISYKVVGHLESYSSRY